MMNESDHLILCTALRHQNSIFTWAFLPLPLGQHAIIYYNLCLTALDQTMQERR